MEKLLRIALHTIFCIQILLVFLLLVESKVQLPPWLQVAGRMHPMVLHIPIGILLFMVLLMLVQRTLDTTASLSLTTVIRIGLVVTSLSASFTALFGFFLSLQGDYGSTVLTQHKVSGVVFSFLCYFMALIYDWQKQKAVFFGAGVAAVFFMLAAGHTGSILTHGENFVMAPVTSTNKEPLTADNASFYHFAVEPVLEKKCFSCHNDSKAKGGLIMTSADKFKAGGKNGEAWIAGNPDESRMIKALYLPLSADEHMPPDGKPQLTTPEIALLKAWIKTGASFDMKVADYKPTDSVKFIAAAFTPSATSSEVKTEYTFNAASEDVIAKMNTPFRSVFPLYQGSPALQADFFVKKAYEVKSLEELKAVADQLVVVNLSRMPVTDKEVSLLATFKNLEQLNLNFSALEGKTLTALKDLKKLKLLSLSGTSIHAKDLEPALAAPALKEVYVWNTPITEVEVAEMAKAHPAIVFVRNSFHDNSILRLSKPALENDGVTKRNEQVVLRHTMPGVAIRYAIDGTTPDSVSGILYKEPLDATETFIIKARACKDTWYCSELYETTVFVEGIKPTNATLLTAPDPQYPGEGAQSLTDHRKGMADVLKEPSWLGYRERAFSATFTFGNDKPHRMVMSYGRNLGAYAFPPAEVEVWAGQDEKSIKHISTLKLEQPKAYDANKVAPLTIPLSTEAYPFYKIVAKPVPKLPAWHSGKGDKGWVFIDEVFFY